MSNQSMRCSRNWWPKQKRWLRQERQTSLCKENGLPSCAIAAKAMRGAGEHTPTTLFLFHRTLGRPLKSVLSFHSDMSIPWGITAGRTPISLEKASATHGEGTVITRAILAASMIRLLASHIQGLAPSYAVGYRPCECKTSTSSS